MSERDLEDEEQGNPLDPMPHWARVAYAARCARVVLPYFGLGIAGIQEKRITALATAIEYVELSAATTRPHEQLASCIDDVIMASGAASRAVYGRGDEVTPTAQEIAAARTSEAVTLVVEHAIAAARGTSKASSELASGAFGIAGTILEEAGAEEKFNALVEDFGHLLKLSLQNKWNENTQVPTTVFIRHGNKPWWKLW